LLRQHGCAVTKALGDPMKRHTARLALKAALLATGTLAGAASAAAQSFQGYHCADGTQFIAAFYDRDSRAHLQIDGRPATLSKRLSWSGSRYQGDGVTLTIAKAGITVKHAGRPATSCEADLKPE
jgi:membrane-bound inhibitor of C-type lysozyme